MRSPLFTSRAVITGAILSIALAVGGPYTANLLQSGDFEATLTTPLVIFLFFILTGLVNTVLGKINRRLMFSRPELILIYIMMLCATAIPTMGFTLQLLPIIVTPGYYATSENGWAGTITARLPGWLTVHDQNAVNYFFEGLPKGVPIPWGVWIKPLLFWTTFILVFYFVNICLMVIMRKQWAEKERLAYPLTQLPEEMTSVGAKNSLIGPFFKNKLMWFGFLIPFLLGLITGLSHYFPTIPKINLYASIPIFRNTSALIFFISFPLIGFTYLISLDVAFSLWFFYLLTAFISGYLTITGAGMTENLGVYGIQKPVFAHLCMGALFAFVFFGLWNGRNHLKDVFRKAVFQDRSVDDSREILSYPVAFWGVLIGLILMAFWIRLSGLPLLSTLIFLGAAFILLLGLTRIVAKTGMPYVVPPMIAAVFLISGFGSKIIGAAGLAALSMTYIWSADFSMFFMPSAAHGLKLASKENGVKRGILWAMLLAIVISIVVSIWFNLGLAYKYGGLNLSDHFYKICPRWPFEYISDKINHPTPANGLGWLFTGIGGIIMSTLIFLQGRFLWWPLNPVGFILGPTWFMGQLWFSVFLAWLIKSLFLKYGGPKVYQTTRPLFLGLILGQFTIVGIWLIIDSFTHTTGNMIFWI